MSEHLTGGISMQFYANNILHSRTLLFLISFHATSCISMILFIKLLNRQNFFDTKNVIKIISGQTSVCKLNNNVFV